MIGGMSYAIGGGVFTTYYVSLSVFLAYAMSLSGHADPAVVCHSDQDEVDGRLFTAVIVLYEYDHYKTRLWVTAELPIVASAPELSCCFFFTTRNYRSRYHPKEVHRKRDSIKPAVAQSRVNPATGGITTP